MSTDPERPVRIIYKKAPIVERVASVITEISDETFWSKFESWKSIVQSEFPDYDPVKEWKLNIKMKADVPVLADALPQVEVTHRFWKRNSEGKRFMSMRVLPRQFTLNLHPETDRPHDFVELYDQLSYWLPRWLAHFDAKECAAVQLDYINLLSAATTPQFVTPTGGIRIGGVLTVFTGPPGAFMDIIPPYDCQIGLMIDSAKPALFHLRVAGLPTGAAVRIDFSARIVKDRPSLSQNQVLAEARFLHDIIIAQFEALFTAAAKKSFEPQ